jgi:solute carrier family 30 (zinc transporter), member 1
MRHSRLTSIDNISIHPASFRQEIIAASRSSIDDLGGSSESDPDDVAFPNEANEVTPLLGHGSSNGHANGHSRGRSRSERPRRDSSVHNEHNHTKPKKPSKKAHGHSHSDMGMNAMVLHVLGDALGNVGVIVTALIIWLTDLPGKYYADPVVSLFITLIILKSAIPLTLASAKILLQATPDHIEVDKIRQDIQRLPGVVSCHHIHIWQLSDKKVVASMHIQVAFPISEASGEKYMELARQARKCLHGHGIHSATIQPEFCLNRTHSHAQDAATNMQYDGAAAGAFPSEVSGECLLDCEDPGCEGERCCEQRLLPSICGTSSRSSHSDHSPDSHDFHG